MVETSLFPRPQFAAFLQSDDAVDPLSYYHYQRLQRLQKTARLQERRSRSHEPGYKKKSPSLCESLQVEPPQRAWENSEKSRKIFAKPSVKVDTGSTESATGETSVVRKSSESKVHSSVASEVKGAQVSSRTGGGEGEIEVEIERGRDRERSEGKQGQSDWVSKPAVRRFNRPVKSASIQGMQRSLQSKPLTRPKTAGVEKRDVGTLTVAPGKREGGRKSYMEDGTDVVDVDEEHAVCVGSVGVQKTKENMAQNYHWTTATQRAYNEVDWAELASPTPPPPNSTVEQFPDPVSQKLTFRRYHSCPEQWQVYGPEWDCVQSRLGEYLPLQPVNFRAPSSCNQHIPGYTGYLAGSGDGVIDHPLLNKLLVRRLTPQPTKISKKANIPSYTGHTHWRRTLPAHNDLVHPNPLTTARIHRELPLEEDPSPFRRTSAMSKMITLVSPYNPFNKIDY